MSRDRRVCDRPRAGLFSDGDRGPVLPFQELDVWADGKAVLCCQDWNEEHVVGDVTKESLREIWLGPALARARELHLRSRGAEIDLCKRCKFWSAPRPGMRLWNASPVARA